MERNPFQEAVESSTISQGTREESRPAIHQVIGKQTSVPDVDLVMAYKLSPASFNHHLGAPENTNLDIHSRTRETFQKFRFPEKSQNSIGGKKKVWMYWRS